ncbi:MAG: hypothetical protein FWF29_06940, partial [Treponema sp.]|nr:hypothetical protein [Treponema sp.]
MKNRFIILFLTLIFISVTAAFADTNTGIPDTDGKQAAVSGSGDLSIHFLELGNKYTGDSIYINYGNIDIVIDAGSRQSSAAAI